MMTSKSPARPEPSEDRWIFSARGDVLVFGAPLVFALALGTVGAWLGLTDDTVLGQGVRIDGVRFSLRVGVLVDLLYHVLLDGPHALATGYRVYFDNGEFRRRPALYAVLPMCVFAGLAVACRASTPAVLRAVSYLNIFHYIRQQFGWMMLAARPQDRRWDAAAIYAATLGPLAWWHAHPTAEGWLYDGDLVFGLPGWAGWLALGGAGAVGMAYVWRAWRRRATVVNRAALWVWASTLLAWWGGILFDWAGERTFLLDILHVFPYLALVFAYGQRKWRGQGWRGFVFSARGAVLYYFSLVVVAALTVWLARGIGPAGGWGASALFALILLTPVTHYLLDGFVWRGEAREVLARRAPPKKSQPLKETG